MTDELNEMVQYTTVVMTASIFFLLLTCLQQEAASASQLSSQADFLDLTVDFDFRNLR